MLVPIRPAVHRTLTLTGPTGRPWSPAVSGLLADMGAGSGEGAGAGAALGA
ncbi:hypothetical protein ACIQOW_16820 [Kitasatospora sp. NPDC091335]|uniref:hypothetical protein n=1 Tax=Kitasatospora sp. NPDC091335 TaxID=3364085 RepID=UPI0037F537E0